MRLYIAIFFIAASLFACTQGAKEETISHYPSGEKKEALTYEQKGSDRLFLKRYEYFKNGKVKKEFSYKENNFFGPWVFWYENGSKFAAGEITIKTLDPQQGVGNGTYFWPNGKKMIELRPDPSGSTSVVSAIYDESGQAYTAKNCPPELKKKISALIETWEGIPLPGK